jgi:ABC-type nitrate/sulfonate/bicarbonate transport system substrate-binding protein
MNKTVSRREFLRGMGTLGALTLGASALAACAAPPAPATEAPADEEPSEEEPVEEAPPAELRKIRTQLLWIKNTEFNGFYAADLKGFYADEGLEVEILPGGPGIVVPDLVAGGDSEIGVWGSSTSFIKSIVGGYELKAFASCFQRSPAGVMSIEKYPDGTEGTPIRTPEDAVGKRIGLQPGAIPGWTVITRKAGLDPETDMEIVEVGWDPTPLFDGTVDGYWCYSTNQPGIARLEGYEIVVLDSFEWGARAYGNFCMATQDTLDNDRDMLVGWLRATIKGWVYANDNIDEMTTHAVEVVSPELELNYDQQKVEAADQIDYMKSDLTEEKGLFWMSPDVWDSAMEDLVSLGELDEPLPADQVMTLDILEEVYKDGKESLGQ